MNAIILAALVAGLAVSASDTEQGASRRIGSESFWVELSPDGLLTAVPATGVRSLGGPRVELVEGFAEWLGLSFDGARGHVEACGLGSRPDWAGRTPLESLSFESDGRSARCVARIGELEVRSDFWFDADGPYLIADVSFSNLGSETVHGLLVTREALTRAAGWTYPENLGAGLPDAPRGLQRRVFALGDLRPGATASIALSYTPLAATGSEALQVVDVPLSLWTDASFPGGLNFGASNGVSWGDYDGDGWPDVFAFSSGHLWRNLGGASWQFAADLDNLIPPVNCRYGSSFGDYNEDGLPDIASEPRKECGGDSCFHLLKNLGGGPNFVDVAPDVNVVDLQPCDLSAETHCWADVDGDLDLDLFLSVYPPWATYAPSSGNYFFRNLGPTGPGRAFRFQEFSAPGGFDNPPGSSRPEGAEFVDVDFDGDVDLYAGGTLFQNNSTPGTPLMVNMATSGSGIGWFNKLEEGADFADHDLDGDFDLYIAYADSPIGVHIWENQGDGTFFLLEPGTIQSPAIGLLLGLSACDWDNDGDIDFTTREIFRRNMLIETGQRGYVVATHAIAPSHLVNPTPAWADWDRDGDLDCALGNWFFDAWFYENTTYDAATPDSDRRYVRVRAVRDSATVARGLETEFGAAVEIDVRVGGDGWRRKQFVSSSAGYLNQNEYALHFALPADPSPQDPQSDLVFDVIADFPSLPSQGFWRVDKHVNPVLGGVDLASLSDREIVVFRSGAVVLDGVSYPPGGSETPLLATAGGGLATADPTAGLPAPGAAPTGDTWVGIDFDTLGASRRVRLRELILDGQLAAPVACAGGSGNVLLWDVTNAGSPVLVAALDESTSARNHRSWLTSDLLLDSGRRYRLVAHVTELRGSAYAGPTAHPELTVHGGLSYSDPAPCSGGACEAATTVTDKLYLSFRFGALQGGCPPPVSYCTAAPNSLGAGCLLSSSGSTSLSANNFVLRASAAAANQPGLFYYGPNQISLPFGDGFRCVGGTIFRLNPPVAADAVGQVTRPLDFTQPPTSSGPGAITAGSSWNFQFWYRDPAAAGNGFNLSDGLSASFCP